MSLIKTLYPLLSTGSTQEGMSKHDRNFVDWDIKYHNKQAITRLTVKFYNDYREHPRENIGDSLVTISRLFL